MSICLTSRFGAALDRTDVLFEPTDHDVVEQSPASLPLTGTPRTKSLRVEAFEQREKLSSGRCGASRKGKAVFEPPGQVSNRSGDLRIDRVFRAARRSSVMGFVEDSSSEPGRKP